MKGTMKRIISILLALALVITSLNYTPKTVSAADYSGLTYTEVTSGDYTFGYSIISNTLGYGAPEFLDNGITMQLAYSADNKAENTVVKINGVETAQGDVVTTIGTGITKFNPSKFEDNAYTHIEITSTVGSTELVIRRGAPTPEEEQTITLPIEAENAALTGNAVIVDSTASNGQHVGNVGAGNAGTVTFTVYANAAGTYNMNVYQFQNDARSFSVTVNGTDAGALACASTGSWNPPATAVAKEITLAEGANTIQFAGVGEAYAPNIDKIEIDLLESEAEATVEALISTLDLNTLTESDANKAKVNGIKASYEALVDNSGVSNADVLEQAYNKVNGIIVLKAPEDLVLYNYRQTGKGYKVVFDDPNKDTVTAGEGETYVYEVYVDNGGYQLIGTVSASEEFISGATVDALGLGEDGNYTIYARAVYTQADGTVVESEYGSGNMTYDTTTTTLKNTGIPSIVIQTADNSVNLWTDASKTKADSTIMIYGTDGVLQHSDFGTANVRGNSTAGAEKKAYNFKMDSKYDVLGVSGDGKGEKKWSLLANAFDKSLLRNTLAMELGNALSIPYNSSGKYVDVYVNGRYMGNYYLIESIEVGSSRVNIDSENDETYNTDALLELENNRGKVEEGCTYIETTRYQQRFVFGSPESAEDSTEEFFTQKVEDTKTFLENFETALASNNLDTIKEYIDIDSFVNFYIVTEFFKQQDIDYSSTRFFIQNGKLYAGPLWDFDLSSGNVNIDKYSAEDQSPESYRAKEMEWYKALMSNYDFLCLVRDRFTEVIPTIQALYEGDGNTIDTLLAEMGTSAALNYTATADGGAGWPIETKDQADEYSYANSYNFTSYEDSVEQLRTWLKNRTTFLREAWDITAVNQTEMDTTTITDWVTIGDENSYTADGTKYTYNISEAFKTSTDYPFANGHMVRSGKAAAPFIDANYLPDEYNNLADGVIYTTVIASEAGKITSVVIDGQKYFSGSENVLIQNDRVYINTNAFVSKARATEETHVITINGDEEHTYALMIAAEDTDAEPDLTTVIANATADTANWIQQAGANDSATVNSAGTIKYLIEESYWTTGANNNGFFNGNIYGYFAKGTSVPYGGLADNTVTGEAFAIAANSMRDTGVASVWISDGTTTEQLVNNSTDLYWATGSDVLTFSASKLALAEGETEKIYYVTVRLTNGTEHSWPIKVEAKAADEIDISAWTEIPVSGTDTASVLGKYYINTAGYNEYVNTAIFGVYAPASKTAYHEGECLLTGNAISFANKASNAMTAIIVDGTEYAAGTDKFHARGDSCEMALELFGEDEDNIHYVTVVGSTNATFAIKYEPATAETTTTEPESVTVPADATWVEVPNSNGTYYYYVPADVTQVNTGGMTYQAGDARIYIPYQAIAAAFKSVTLTNVATGEATTITPDAGAQVFVLDSYMTTDGDYQLRVVDFYGTTTVDMYIRKGADSEESSSDEETDTTTTETAGTTIAAPVGLAYTGNADLPYYWAWQAVAGAASYNFYVNGELVGSTAGTAFEVTDATIFAEAGDYTIGVTAVNADGVESDKTEITYTEPEKTPTETTTEAPGEPKPDVSGVEVPAADGWTQITGGVGAANDSKYYVPTNTTIVTGDCRELENKGSDVAYGGDGNNPLTMPVYGFSVSTGTPESVWVTTSDGTSVKLTSENSFINTNVISIAQSMFEVAAGEEEIFYVTLRNADGIDNTYPLKVVGEQAPDTSDVTLPADDAWFQIVTGAGAADGSTWYVPTATDVIGADVRELENTGADVAYGGLENNTLTVPVFGFSLSTGTPKSIWIDGVKLSSDQIYINTNVVSIAQSAFEIEPGDTKIFYVTARNADGSDHTFPVKIVAPEPEATWSDWTAMTDASGAATPTVDYYYSTLSTNTIAMGGASRELLNTILVEFGEGLGSVKSDSVEFTYGGAAVEINKSELVEGQEYILEVTNGDGSKSGQVKIKYDPAPSLAPTGVTVSTNRGDIESTTDDTATVSWVNSDDAVVEGCSYVIQLKTGDEVITTVNANSTNATAGLDLSAVEYGTYDVVITTYDADGKEVDTQTIAYKYLDPYAVDSDVNFNNTLWEKFRYQAITWTKVEAATSYAIYADGKLVGTTTDLAYNVDAYNYATNTIDITDADGNVVKQATTVGDHTTTVVAVFEGDTVQETLETVNAERIMGTNDFPINVNYVYGKDTDIWNNSGVDSKWNFTITEIPVGEVSEGASVIVNYDETGAAELEILDNGTHDGADQEWTIKAAIYDEAILEGEIINLSFDIVGPADLVGQQISIKCCSEEVDDNGVYTGAEALYEEKYYTFEELKDEEGNVIGSIIHYSNSFESTHDSYDLLFGLGELEPTTLTLTDASATKVYGVTSVSASGIVNTEDPTDNSMYISWETNVPDLLKEYYTYTLNVYDTKGTETTEDDTLVIEDDNATPGTIYEGMNANLVDGTYRVEVSSVYDGTITATKETTATIDTSAAYKPDLVISDISIVDPSIEYRIGDTVHFNVTMTNIGSEDATLTAGNITMWLFVKNPTTGELINVNYYIKDYVDGSVTLAKGESITKSVEYKITDDHCLDDYLFTFTARADADYTIDELNENNNESSKIFMFNPALKDVTFENNGEDIIASWPVSADTTLETYRIEYVNADGEKVTVNSTTPSITLPDGTYFKNDSEVKVTAVCNDGTEYLYADGVARADLIIESMNPVDGVALVGDVVNFVAIVKNIGVAPATSKEGSTQEAAVTFTSGSMNGLYASDYVIGADNQPIYKTLNPNDESTIYLYSTYVPTVAGTEEYSAVTDDINRILESKDTVDTAENNNTYSGEFIVLNKSPLELKLNEPEDGTSYVSATWTDNNILETSNPKLTVEGYQITYTNAAGETVTKAVDKSANTYVFTEELKNNTPVKVSALYTEYRDAGYVQIANTTALADLVITDIVIPYETGDGIEGNHLYSERAYKIELIIKNQGTASLPEAEAPEGDEFKEYGDWILSSLKSTNSEYFESVDTPANYSIRGLVAGQTDTLTYESVTFNEEGDYTLTAKVDDPGHAEAEATGYIAESDETNNTITESFSVKFVQNTEMDWTRLVHDNGTGTSYLFPVASGSQNAYIDYKILTTTETNYHYEDIINKYVGYNGANMSIGFQPDKTIVYFDGGDGTNHSYTKFEFAQVPNWSEFVEDENGNIVYETDAEGNLVKDEKGNPIPLETTPDEDSKELVWITLPDKASTIHDVSGTEGNLSEEIIATDVSDSPMGYNGNGYNFFVGNFGLYKCYLMKFTTPVPALDNYGNYTYDADGNMIFEYDEDGNLKYDEIVVAFRVTDDKIRTNNWMQALASDGVSNPDTLPIPYCGGDSYTNGDADGIVDTVKDIIYADGENKHQIREVDKSTVIDDTNPTDNEHEDTEASKNYDTIGALWYDASDILLSSVSVYNGNWLSISTSEYLEISKGNQDNAGTKNLRVGIARAIVDPTQNNKFVGYATDFVVTDPNKEGTHLGVQGTNTIHVGLPWLLQELPTHSDRVDANGKALPKDQEYYWIRVWADITDIQETEVLEDGTYTQLANYIDIPVTVYYDVPQIQPAQNVTAITSYDDNDQNVFTLSWGALDEMNAYGYKYKVFYTDENGEDVDISLDLAKSSGIDTSAYVEGTEYYFDSPQALTSDAATFSKVATYDEASNTVEGSLKVVAYWCEQEIPVVVDIQPPHEEGWYSIDGESEIIISAGQSSPIDMNGYMSYYYNRSQNHSSGTIGYNGYYVSLNGNTRWYASNSIVSVATGTDEMFESRTDMTATYESLYAVVDDKQDPDAGTLAKTTVTETEEGLGLQFKTVENPNENGYVAGQLQIEAKTLFQATNLVTWYLIKVETPILDESGNETGDVRVAYIMAESLVEVGGDVAVRGFQMNTDATPGGVSEYSPSFRVVSRASKLVADPVDQKEYQENGVNIDLGEDKPLYQADGTINSLVSAIVAQGTIYGQSSVDDELLTVSVKDADGNVVKDENGNIVVSTDEAAGVYQIPTTAGGVLTAWSGAANDADASAYTYYAVTFKPMKYSVKTLKDTYNIKAYMVTEDGNIVYESEETDPVKTASVYTIAEILYSNGDDATSTARMANAEDHKFLYDNVLNINAIADNYTPIGKAMLTALGVTSKDSDVYKYVNETYKDLYYYAHLAMHYSTSSYINRGDFIARNESSLLPLLNGVKKNSETDYATIADWIYGEIDHTSGFYEKVEYVTPDNDGTVENAGESV